MKFACKERYARVILVSGVLAALLSGAVEAAPKAGQSKQQLIERGRQLFTNETFNGNGRTCATCHPASNNFTIDPAFIAKLPANDPLFVAETNPDLAKLENSKALRQHALISENVDGFDRPAVLRGVPHTLGLPVSMAPDDDADSDQVFPDGTKPVSALGWSADGSPEDGSLRQFAVGAVRQHFTKTMDRVEGVDFRLPTDDELDALEAFQRSLGRQEEVDLAALTFLDDAAQRGKDLFEGVGVNRACTACHANAGANVVDDEDPDEGFNDNFDTGTRLLGTGPAEGGFRPGSPERRGRVWQWDDEYTALDRSRRYGTILSQQLDGYARGLDQVLYHGHLCRVTERQVTEQRQSWRVRSRRCRYRRHRCISQGAQCARERAQRACRPRRRQAGAQFRAAAGRRCRYRGRHRGAGGISPGS
jgi:mono/diheme cytochrome c family protein